MPPAGFRFVLILNFLHEQRKPEGIMHQTRKSSGGTPVFVGTRVPLQEPVRSLSKRANRSKIFSKDFPSVKREQVIAVIEERGQARMLDTALMRISWMKISTGGCAGI